MRSPFPSLLRFSILATYGLRGSGQKETGTVRPLSRKGFPVRHRKISGQESRHRVPRALPPRGLRLPLLRYQLGHVPGPQARRPPGPPHPQRCHHGQLPRLLSSASPRPSRPTASPRARASSSPSRSSRATSSGPRSSRSTSRSSSWPLSSWPRPMASMPGASIQAPASTSLASSRSWPSPSSP